MRVYYMDTRGHEGSVLVLAQTANEAYWGARNTIQRIIRIIGSEKV
jgi:hypothetical protein